MIFHDIPLLRLFRLHLIVRHFPVSLKKEYTFCYLRAWFIIVTLLGGEFNLLITLEKKFYF